MKVELEGHEAEEYFIWRKEIDTKIKQLQKLTVKLEKETKKLEQEGKI